MKSMTMMSFQKASRPDSALKRGAAGITLHMLELKAAKLRVITYTEKRSVRASTYFSMNCGTCFLLYCMINRGCAKGMISSKK